jgi:hypothetical protein
MTSLLHSAHGTRPRSLSALALLALLVLALAAPGASGASERLCGDLHGTADAPHDVRAIAASCRRARSLARSHARGSGRGERCDLAKASCVLDGYRCRRTFFGSSGTRVRCTHDAEQVRFFYGV